MNLLITGATGFVGRHLIPVLISERHDIHILIRPNSEWKYLGVSHAIEFTDDISNLTKYLVHYKIDGIIHLASLYVAEHKPEQIKDIVLSNIYLGTALLEACKNAKIKWFLNTGTIWQNYQVPDYSDSYNPVNLYAASKQAFMTMAKYYTETSDLRFCTLKLCDTYGENDTRKKIYALFDQFAKTGETLDMSPGNQCLDIIHIDDVVAGFIQLAEMLQRGDCFKPEYVLSSGKHIALKELAKLYALKKNVQLNINWGGLPYRQREVMAPYRGYVLCNWHPKTTLFDK